MMQSRPVVLPLVGAIRVGCSMEQFRLFVECLPSNLIDVERKSLNKTAHLSGSENYTAGGQTLHNTIRQAQDICARFQGDVVPQNLFFIFGECAQTLVKLALELPAVQKFSGFDLGPVGCVDSQQSAAQQEPNANAWAVVLCHIDDAQPLRQICGRKQDKAQHQSNCYQVTGAELDGLKKLLDEVIDHGAILSGNDPKAHRKCDHLGVCQARMPACNGCVVKCLPGVNTDTDPSPTSLDSLVEEVSAWIATAAVALATVAVLFGAAGYFWGGL